MRMNLNKGDLIRFKRIREGWVQEHPITGIVLGWENLVTSGKGSCGDLRIIEDTGKITNYIIMDRDHVEVLSESR